MAPLRDMPMRVLITGAAGQIGYALAPMVARGAMLGAEQGVILHLLDIPFAADSLEGVRMELIDAAYPLVKGQLHTGCVPSADTLCCTLWGPNPRRTSLAQRGLSPLCLRRCATSWPASWQRARVEGGTERAREVWVRLAATLLGPHHFCCVLPTRQDGHTLLVSLTRTRGLSNYRRRCCDHGRGGGVP
jgi:hypothetical protein